MRTRLRNLSSAATLGVVTVVGLDAAIALFAARGLDSLWIGDAASTTAFAMAVCAVAMVCGYVASSALLIRPAWRERSRALLVAAFALFGIAWLPQPWSYSIAIRAADRVAESPETLANAIDLAVATGLAAPLPLLIGAMAALCSSLLSRGSDGTRGWGLSAAAAGLGGLFGTALAVDRLQPWPGSVDVHAWLALPSFAAAALLALLRSSSAPSPLLPPRRARTLALLALPLAIAACGLLRPVMRDSAWWPSGDEGLAAACEAPNGQPNVLLVSVDTLRADALGSYGGPVRTPHFDALAGEGVRFEAARSPASETAPSHATLFTGQRVLMHGVRKNGVPLEAGAGTLAERFRDAGYRTASFVSSFVLDPRFGWDQGFDHLDARFPRALASFDARRVWHPDAFWNGQVFEGFDRPGAWTAKAAGDWIRRQDGPFFAFVHLFDVHEPHKTLRHLRRRVAGAEIDIQGRQVDGMSDGALERLNRDYFAEVLAADEALGTLLKSLRSPAVAACTIVVVTSDHGQGLGQHGWFGHEINVFEEQLRVPLLFYWPGHAIPGHVAANPVGLEDVAPTLAEMAGLPADPAAQGRSLAAAVLLGRPFEERTTFAYRRNYETEVMGQRGHQNAVRKHGWKYIRSSDAEDALYDLGRDPGETHNLLDRQPTMLRPLAAELDEWLNAAPDREPVEPLPDDVARGLKALGYTE